MHGVRRRRTRVKLRARAVSCLVRLARRRLWQLGGGSSGGGCACARCWWPAFRYCVCLLARRLVGQCMCVWCMQLVELLM